MNNEVCPESEHGEPSAGVYCRTCIRLSPFESVLAINGGELAWFCCDHCGQRNEIIGWAARWLAIRPTTRLVDELLGVVS